MRSDRLLATLLLLQAHGRLPASEIALRLEVSVRTVYRDIEALSLAGVPVYMERGHNGGCVLLPGYRTDVSGLSTAEAGALFAAANGRALAGLGLDEELRGALRKLTAALPERQRPEAVLAPERIIVEPGGWLRSADPPPFAEAVRRAIWDERRIRIRYRSSGAVAATERLVDPWALVAKGGTWYLIAAPAEPAPDRDLDERPAGRDQGEPGADARLYRLSRFEGVTATAEPANRPPGLKVARVWERLRRRIEDRGSGIEVLVRSRPERTEMLLRLVAVQLVGPPVPESSGPDGWPVHRLPFVAAGAAVGVLLGFGDDVEVLGPESVRAAMAATAADVVRLYAETASSTAAVISASASASQAAR